MSNLDDLLARLDGVKSHSNGHLALCPAHADHEPSLDIAIGESGKILLHCHAGCPSARILEALDMSWGDLYSDEGSNNMSTNASPVIVATYDYTNEAGKLLYQVVRYAPKSFKQRRPNANGGWVWNLKNTRRVLYRLHEIATAHPDEWIFVAEGEKSTDAVRSLGLVATTNSGGAGSWGMGAGPEYYTPLIGRRVAVLADNDEKGNRHALDVARILRDVAAEVKVIRFPQLRPGGDAYDWITGGGTRDLLVQMAEGAEPATAAVLGDLSPLSTLTADEILDTEWPEPVWAVPGILPAGLAVLAGRPKVGKSWLALQIAQGVAAGGVALGQNVDTGPVLYLALEDIPTRLQDRMKRQAWPRGLPAEFYPMGKFLDEVGDLRNGGGDVLGLQIEAKGYRLVVIDTLSRAVFGDQNDVDAMTRALTPLQEMAHMNNCAVLLVDHHNKLNTGDAIADILGSTAKGAMCDCVLGLYREGGKAKAKLKVIGRDVVEQTLALSWDGLTGCWQSEGDADELQMTENRQDIVDALTDMGPSTNLEISGAVQRNKGSVYRDLQELLAAGYVLKSGSRYRTP